MAVQYYTASKIFTGREWLSDTLVEVEAGRVTRLLSKNTLPAAAAHSLGDHWIVPAFVDIQLYGAQERLLAVAPDVESVKAIADWSRAGGAVLTLPTVATNTQEVFFACIDAIRAYWNAGGTGVWGLHLEGPWLNPQKRGAHVERLIHSPTLDEVKQYLNYGKDVIRMITLAPEVCSPEVLDYLLGSGITLSAGHSNASFEEAMAAFDKGIPAITHLYNAMSPLGHRAPGLTGAAFLHPTVNASVIADGYHVDFAALKIAKQVMGERLFAITDAVTTTTAGHYQHQLAGDKYECNGVLSGSALTQYRSFINLVTRAGIEVEEALRMCSLYPANVIGAGGLYGKIAPGYAAQWVVLTKQLQLVDVVIL